MSEETQSFKDAVTALNDLYSDPKVATEADEDPETDAEADEAEAHEDEFEDSAEGDEPSTEEESEEEDAESGVDLDEDALVTVKLDGKSQKVRLKDVLSGYQQNTSYTQKSMALAEERKAFQAEQQAIRQERAQYATLLDALNHQVSQVTAQEPNWEYLRANDPQIYMMAKFEWNELQEKQRAIQSEQQRLAHDAQVQEAHEFHTRVAEEKELLLQEYPELRDPEKYRKMQKDVREYASKVKKFSEEELNRAADHRALGTLIDGMRAYNARNTKGEPVKSVAKRVPVGSAAATPRKPSAAEAAIKRAKQSRSISDAAEALRHLNLE